MTGRRDVLSSASARSGWLWRHWPMLVVLAVIVVVVASWLPGRVYHRLLPWSAPWFNHFLAYGVLAATVAMAWVGNVRRWLLAAVALVLLAGVMELGQHLALTRYPRWADWGWGVAGALCGLTLGSIGRCLWRRHCYTPLSWWTPSADNATRLRELGRHRLWPLADLLHERGLIPASLLAPARQLAVPMRARMKVRAAEEQRVTAALVEAGCRFLVLKGCLLAHGGLYRDALDRYREDLDILIRAEDQTRVEKVLAALGYQPSQPVAGGSPMSQRQWQRQGPDGSHYLDLHWDLRNHPRLQSRFSFEELAADAQPLPALAAGVAGLGPGHALLHAVMHHFDHHGQEPADQGLLDVDLLWRSLSAPAREAMLAQARERGLSGLLAAALNQARARFGTPVSDGLLQACRQVGAAQPASALLVARQSHFRAQLLAWRSEPDWRARWRRLRAIILPPAAYMRHNYPEGSRLGLTGLYLRRLWQRLLG
ncbi:MAG: nucleotidyltransferase family protein [Xanthomonadales bacterium]|nr:nucleotidyltransferase family protein [Xanthomonadales bacterium]